MAITRRDDLTATIQKYIERDTKFSLIPGKRLLTKRNEKVAYTGLFIECPQDKYVQVFDAMCKVFTERHEDLQNLAFVPKKSTRKISIDDLFKYAEAQNKLHHNLKGLTIKGINSTLQQVEMADISKASQTL